jgi:hypothetical protein
MFFLILQYRGHYNHTLCIKAKGRRVISLRMHAHYAEASIFSCNVILLVLISIAINAYRYYYIACAENLNIATYIASIHFQYENNFRRNVNMHWSIMFCFVQYGLGG